MFYHTAEIIRKLTMALLINSNKDFDSVDSLTILFSHYVKETHMMLVAFLVLVKIVVASQHKRLQNKYLPRFVDY